MDSGGEKYVEEGGLGCIICGSGDLTVGKMEYSMGHVYAMVTCEDCGTVHREEYSLTDVTLFIGEK